MSCVVDVVDSVSTPRVIMKQASESARSQKIIVVLPAYNAARTLEHTVKDIPLEWVDDIVLVDDASQDETWSIAQHLGVVTARHETNLGYGGNQKTCYAEALRRGADIVVMVHPDFQYDPKLIPQLIAPLLAKQCDAVFGSRMLGGEFIQGGMPIWKFYGNLWLTALENMVFEIFLSEYHTGFRAYSRHFLETVNLQANSNSFVFDTEIIAQAVVNKLRIQEVPISTRYHESASQIGMLASVRYAFSICGVLIRYKLHCLGWRRSRLFYSSSQRGTVSCND